MMNTSIDFLSVREAAEQRRSIRAYEPGLIPREDLEEILDVVRRAPSAFNVQPWRFVIVRDPELKDRLAEAAYGQQQVRAAPAVLVLYSDMLDVLETADEVVHPGLPADRRAQTVETIRQMWAGKSAAERESWGAGQSYIALGYLLLAARSMGYDTSAMLGFDPARVKSLLGLPEHVAVPALVAVDVAAEEGFPHHRHGVNRIADFR